MLSPFQKEDLDLDLLDREAMKKIIEPTKAKSWILLTIEPHSHDKSKCKDNLCKGEFGLGIYPNTDDSLEAMKIVANAFFSLKRNLGMEVIDPRADEEDDVV